MPMGAICSVTSLIPIHQIIGFSFLTFISDKYK